MLNVIVLHFLVVLCLFILYYHFIKHGVYCLVSILYFAFFIQMFMHVTVVLYALHDIAHLPEVLEKTDINEEWN